MDTDKVLRMFSEKISDAQQRYIYFINEPIELEREDLPNKTIGQQIMGDDRFVEEVERKIEKIRKPLKKTSLQEILMAIKRATGVSDEEILSRRRKKDVIIARALMVAVCRETGYRLVDLEPILKRDLSVLSRLVKYSESTEGRKIIEKVLEELNAYMQA